MDFTKRYQFNPQKDLLGKGGFSKVYRAVDTIRKRTVALKFFYGNWSDKYDVIGEINRMDDIVHPNLIRYYDADILESTNAIGETEKIQVGILEYANAGDITRLFKNKSEALIKKVISDILNGLKYLHDCGIVHRDMKPKNILLSQSKDGELMAKIADFGISKKIGFEDKTASTQLLGSVEYMAPEQFNPTKYGVNGAVQTNLDLWSVGIIIYELFTQSTPFGSRSTGLTNEEILSNILFKDIVIQYDQLAEPYRSIVRACLVKDASKRVQKADELLAILTNNKPVETIVENIDLNATQVLTRPTLDQVMRRDPDLKDGKQTEVLPMTKKPSREEREVKMNKAIERIQKDEVEKKDQTVQIDIPTQKVFLEYDIAPDPDAERSIKLGKDFFKQKNYIRSYPFLAKNLNAREFDAEAKFYLGFMLYNGKCGGAHNFNEGKRLMDEAKKQNRSLVMDLVLKYVLGKNKT